MNYNEIIENIENVLDRTKFVALSTANKKGEIDVAQMCIVNNGLIIYMQTDKNFQKIKNIMANPNIAINIGNYTFMGAAKVLGSPNLYSYFIEKIKVKHPDVYKHFTNLENEVLIEIQLKKAKIWNLDINDFQDKITLIDFEKELINEIICDKL